MLGGPGDASFWLQFSQGETQESGGTYLGKLDSVWMLMNFDLLGIPQANPLLKYRPFFNGVLGPFL